MPNYIVHIAAVEPPFRPPFDAHGAVIQATVLEADGVEIFAYFSEAKAAAIRCLEESAAKLKERRVIIRGLREKDLTKWQQPLDESEEGESNAEA